jgi:starch synthase (maltosyl-transferring)
MQEFLAATEPAPGEAGGRARVVIEGITPQIDAGRYPIKRVLGETVIVEADCFADGHDVVSVLLKFRSDKSPQWSEVPMEPLVNDRWRGEFPVEQLGNCFYTVEGWVDHFKSWRKDFQKKVAASQDVSLDLLSGAQLVESAAARAPKLEARALAEWARTLSATDVEPGERVKTALDPAMAELMARFPDRRFSTVARPELRVMVDPVLARFGAWYEMFPRSCPGKEGAHGTFKDCEKHLSRVAGMGFDILYLPPIHPIGRAYRKGKNNHPVAQPDDVGSPWGIGASEGGHKSIHPRLGTLADFQDLVRAAEGLKIKIALDIAYQCSPDHPYVREHPEWFKKRADGSIQYAENPPKKYQDIYPIDFESDDWKALWHELKSVVEYWIEQGVEVFRVDNPHTKALPFWEWMINDVKARHPQVIFLAEAFTRPKLMYNLAKLGFTQSYNYFPWRNGRQELTEFFTELTRTEVGEFFRPNLWPNTPDILTQALQYGGRPAFMIRLILAATLGASYGIYGPAFELCENQPRESGSEEYLNSEKYEIREWNLDQPHNLAPLIARLNAIRRENPALHANERIEFHETTNDQFLAYSKTTPDLKNIILTIVNLDPHHVQSGWVTLPLPLLEIDPVVPYQVHDLVTDARFLWIGPRNYVELNPALLPAHVFRVRKRVRTEHDFDYYF